MSRLLQIWWDDNDGMLLIIFFFLFPLFGLLSLDGGGGASRISGVVDGG